MNVLYDHLTSIVIAGVVTLMIFGLQNQMRASQVERTAMYTAKEHALDFGQWLQKDLANVGAGIISGNPVIETIDTSSTGNTSEFRFRRTEDDAAGSPVVVVKYELVAVDSIKIGASKQPLYEVRRFFGGKAEGKSAPLMTRFRIELLDASGNYTSSWTNALVMHISFRMALPFKEQREKAFMDETHWETMLPLRK